MGKRVTLEEIGKLLGVSAVTVSKALKDQKGVSDELRLRIQQTAAELGYRKSRRAHNQKIPRTIGVIIAERFLENHQSFYWALYQKLAERVLEKECVSVLEIISGPTEVAGMLPKLLEEKRVDGAVIVGNLKRGYMESLYRAFGGEIPLICLDSELGPSRRDTVISDNIGGGYELTDYLLSLGHRRIGFVGTFLTTSSIDDRYLGYVKALLERGLEAKKEWLIEDRDRESGALLGAEALQLPEDPKAETAPTAYFCNCDVTAAVLIRALEARGLRVPEDVSVVGFDNHLPKGNPDIRITTYEIDARLMAVKTVSRILKKIESPNDMGGITVIGGRFIEGNSARRIGPAVPFA